MPIDRGKPLSYNLRPFQGQWSANHAMGKSKPRVFRSHIKARHPAFYNVNPIFYRTPTISNKISTHLKTSLTCTSNKASLHCKQALLTLQTRLLCIVKKAYLQNRLCLPPKRADILQYSLFIHPCGFLSEKNIKKQCHYGAIGRKSVISRHISISQSTY